MIENLRKQFAAWKFLLPTWNTNTKKKRTNKSPPWKLYQELSNNSFELNWFFMNFSRRSEVNVLPNDGVESKIKRWNNGNALPLLVCTMRRESSWKPCALFFVESFFFSIEKREWSTSIIFQWTISQSHRITLIWILKLAS